MAQQPRPSAAASRITWLDRLVSWFDPAAGRRRMLERMLLARAYEAASPRDPWRPRRAGASANADHLADAKILREKARTLVQNVPYVAAGIEALVAQVVGTGITPQSEAKPASSARKLDELFARWSGYCDADGHLDWPSMQAMLYGALEVDGEVLVRFRERRLNDGYEVPLQIQALEIDWLDTQRNERAPDTGNEILAGIEYNAIGGIVAYWLYDHHPGDVMVWRRGLRGQSRRVSAANIIHLFRKSRPGQGRGFTRLAPVIARVRDLQLYEDAELARKNLETRMSVIASGDVSQLENRPPELGSQTAARTSGELGELASGAVTQLPPGLNMTVIEPKPVAGYADYIKLNLHLVAAGMGITYEMLTGDVRETNFSSARVRMLDFRRQAEATQWLLLVPQLCIPVWRRFVEAAIVAGHVRETATIYDVDHSTPKWDYVNPQQDVNADRAEVEAGLSSLSEKLRRRGYDPKRVFKEIQSDFRELERLGVLGNLMLLWKGKGGDAPQAAQGEKLEAEESDSAKET